MIPESRAPRLSRPLLAALYPVTVAAAEAGVRIAVVGGVVRDRLLRRPPAGRDADVVVEGDAVALARRVARGRGLRVRVHERFGTATLETSEGWTIDLAGARSETYDRPGALPGVSPATLEEDLSRRDFTVNAMALELPPPPAPARLHDPFGGRADLARRRLRTLHPASFWDDPTRALRAVRYGNRLDLRLERETARRLREAVGSGALDTVSGNRIRRELERTLSEPGAAGAVRRMVDLGIGRAIHRELDTSDGALRALARAERLARCAPFETTWMLPLLVWAGAVSEAGCRELARRLSLAATARRILERWPATRSVSPGSGGAGVGRLRLSPDERVAAAALVSPGPASREARRRLLSVPLRLSIRGADLLEAGVPPGPRIGRALAETEVAREAGRIAPAQELAFAVAAARRRQP